MAALPLLLDTLQSPSIEEPATQSPLMSPQMLKAEDSSNNSLLTTTITPERPSNLTLDSSTQQHHQQHQQQHSNITPTHGTISPALSSAGSLSPSFLPEMPQWKRDLIQRRKQNVQRTISASSPTASAAASSPLAGSPTTTSSIYGLKTSTSSSSVRSLAGSNTNIDQVASDGLHTSTKDYNKTSLSSSSSSSLLTTANTTKVNKQHATITTTTTTAMPATHIKSPIQEKAEKLFGGQYTATQSSSSSSTSISATVTTHFTTKEEKKITTTLAQQEMMEGLKENEEEEAAAKSEHWEKSKKTKEYLKEQNNEEEEEDENDETQISTVTTTTTTTSTLLTNNKQQMATRLTGSTHNNTNVLNQRENMLKERELIVSLNNTTAQHNNITGANVILQNQSLNKCESERVVCAANIGSVVKIAQKFIKNEQQQQINTNTKKFIKFKTNSYSSQDLKSPTKALTSANSSSSSALATNCAIKKKMVAVQEMKKSTQNTATHLHPISTTCNNSNSQQANNRANNNRNNGGGGVANSSASNATDLDNNEDLSYGPGIVSKLRCRYLSLALRESMEQQRLNKDQLRRSTSLNNLLDNNEDDDENCDDDDEEEEEEEYEDNIEVDGGGVELREQKKNISDNSMVCKKSGILKNSCNNQEKRFSSHNSQGSNGVGVTFTETSFNKRSRHLKRGNDSLKRARSVEALLSEKSPWQSRSLNHTTPLPTCVTIEDKIHNARERLHQGSDHMPPKRLSSIIDDTERPPPDLVKQTLKMFEASANRRPRSTRRSNSKGDVASKVETFKNIIKDQKPVVSYPKPLSPTKKLNSSPLLKPLKVTSPPQASDLLQSPLGRKTLATANSITATNEGLTPLKTTNTLSDNTPDIIPRQKVLNERDFKQSKEKFTTNQINKEKFLNSIRDTPLSNTEIMDSPLNLIKRDQKEKFEVDSPLTALTKELSKLKLSDNNTPTRKIDNFSTKDIYEKSNGGGGRGGVGGGDGVSVVGDDGDACLSHNKYLQINEETKELTSSNSNSSSLKNENDKQKQINNETIDETTNEAATVNYNDCLATKASPPPSSSDLSDGEEDDDEYGGLKSKKRITRTALDNIAKAGYTQQFKFNTSNSSSTNSPNNTTHSSSSPLNSVKQIGVIRPLLNTNQQQQQQKISSDMDTLKHSTPSSLTSREIEKNRINDLKKSSSATTTSSNSSPNTSLDNVIKSSSSSSIASASANSEVDTVISATNSPLWAMRKRRQAPPAASTENTTMVFNFSNRKEVPDYIENDGVIFRRKRELPKPNESGFVLLGDLSVETSTDFDCDDFSMCPPSPCDVEFENANIVIDGKSSIRQKSKDASFRVQFNDTLTSTFEYPSEASLIVDDSFSAYNDVYTQPHGSSGDDFQQAFQNLVLENFAASADQMSNPFPLHHVADEIIQLPTNQASSPANTTTGVTTPTKNILGNLPLDYPDLEKGIQLTIPTTETTAATTTALNQTQDNKLKRSRKDLNLPLGNQQQLLAKPPLPMKRFQMMPLKSKPQNLEDLEIKSKVLQLPKNNVANVSKHKEEDLQNANIKNEREDLIKPRKTPQVLNNPQYACFLQQQQQPENSAKYPVQRSRSNEFQKSFGSINMTTPVLRSNSLRNLEKFHTSSPALNPTTYTTTTTSLYFTAEVNSSTDNILKPKVTVTTAKIPAKEYRTLKSVSLHNLPQSTEFFENFSNSCHELTLAECRNKMTDNFLEKLSPAKSLNTLTENSCYLAENLLNSKAESMDNFHKTTTNFTKQMTDNLLTSSEQDFHYSTEYSVNMTDNLLDTKAISVDNFVTSEMAENLLNSTTKSLNDLAVTDSSLDLTDYTVNLNENLSKSKSFSVSEIRASVRSSVNDLKEYFSVPNKSKINDLTEETVKMTENLLNSEIKTVESAEYSSKMTDIQSNADDLKPLQKTSVNIIQDTALKTPSRTSFNNLNKSLQLSIDSLDDYQDALEVSPESVETQKSQSVKSNCEVVDLSEENEKESIAGALNKSLNETLKLSKSQEQLTNSEALEVLENLAIGSHKEYSSITKQKLKDSNALEISDSNKTLNETLELSQSQEPIKDSKALTILEDLAGNSHKEYHSLTNDKLNDAGALEIPEALGPNQESLTKSYSSINKEKLKDSKALEISESKKCLNETLKLSQTQEQLTNSEALEVLEDLALDPSNEYGSIPKEKLLGEEALEFTEALGPKTLTKAKKQLTDSEALDIPEDNSKALTPKSFFDFRRAGKNKADSLQIGSKTTNEISTKDGRNLANSYRFQENPQLKPLNVKTTGHSFNFTNSSCENVSTYSTFRNSQNFCRHTSKSFKNSLKFYETLNDKSCDLFETIKRSKSFTGNLSNKGEINKTNFAKSSKTINITEKYSNENSDSPTENSYSFEYYDASGDLNGNLVNSTDNAGLNNNENLLKQKDRDFEQKFEVNVNLVEENTGNLKESFNLYEDCSLTINSLPLPAEKTADLTITMKEVEDKKTCVINEVLAEAFFVTQINLEEAPKDLNLNPSLIEDLISTKNEADLAENICQINRNLSTENLLQLNPNNDKYFNTSPRPFRRQYEAITVVVSPEKSSPADGLWDLNSNEKKLTLTSPRPFKKPSKSVDNNPSVNFKKSRKLNLTNSFGTLTNNLGDSVNNLGFLTKSMDSALNVDPKAKSSSSPFLTKKEFECLLGNSTGNLDFDSTKSLVEKPLSTIKNFKSLGNSETSVNFKSLGNSETAVMSNDSSSFSKSAAKFSSHSPTLASSKTTFSNTKHFKLQTKLFGHDNSSEMVKDPATQITTPTNKTLLKKSTNFETKVAVSKPKTYATSISQTSTSSFSSHTFCRLSSEAKAKTANTQQLNCNSTTIASNSTNPPKVLPRRIFTTAPRNLVATIASSSTGQTATTVTAPISSSSSSSTFSCFNASSSTASTNNSTPLRRRIPGNTLYYV